MLTFAQLVANCLMAEDLVVPLQGIVFSVRPPKKSWKNIANLSGGEKTLSSLSLVFALHHYKPTPLYVMDEIDAALGEPSSNDLWCTTASICHWALLK